MRGGVNLCVCGVIERGALPLEAVSEAGSRVVLALTRHGGHIGFLAGLLPTGRSLLDRAVPEFVSAVFQHAEEFAVAAVAGDGKEEMKNGSEEGNGADLVDEATATFY
ncbi:unnamed protein product [Hydatigera taeniaeformis]|uniref:Uncharacterized protein n=1 Tax=Hydatigena taeniaeformis TaxID=6205 RepID=A0A0R3XA15_HYDTA|nr:unnamed protein product [Hydatigera taeniaeformis]